MSFMDIFPVFDEFLPYFSSYLSNLMFFTQSHTTHSKFFCKCNFILLNFVWRKDKVSMLHAIWNIIFDIHLFSLAIGMGWHGIGTPPPSLRERQKNLQIFFRRDLENFQKLGGWILGGGCTFDQIRNSIHGKCWYTLIYQQCLCSLIQKSCKILQHNYSMV